MNYNIVNLVIIGVIIYIVYKLRTDNKQTENFEKKDSVINKNTIDDIINSIHMNNNTYRHKKSIKKRLVNKHFLNMQFHDDYRDVITALQDMVPTHKQMFNIANQPLLNYSEPSAKEVSNMIAQYIKGLNVYIRSNIKEHRTENSGWDDAEPDQAVQSGWEKQRERLGLVQSVHTKPSGKSYVRLVNIEKVQKYVTDDEIKYSVFIVIQKDGVEDQMAIKVSFIMNKKGLRNEDNFFDDKDVDIDVVMEEACIEGYWSNYGTGEENEYDPNRDNYYNIDKLEYNNLTDSKYIMDKLTERHNKRQREMEYRNSLLDEEGRDFHATLPSPSDYQSYQATQNIYDDFISGNKVKFAE